MCACACTCIYVLLTRSLPLLKLANKLLLELPLLNRITFTTLSSLPFVLLFVSLGETLSNLLQSAHHHSSSPSLLVQRSVARHTILGKTLAQGGGFCDVYEGRWRNDRVLVKIYPSKYEKMWFTETEIYQVGGAGWLVVGNILLIEL